MDRKISFQQAINEALAQEMERDSRVIVMGEDVAGGKRHGRQDGCVGRGAWRHQGTLG